MLFFEASVRTSVTNTAMYPNNAGENNGAYNGNYNNGEGSGGTHNVNSLNANVANNSFHSSNMSNTVNTNNSRGLRGSINSVGFNGVINGSYSQSLEGHPNNSYVGYQLTGGYFQGQPVAITEYIPQTYQTQGDHTIITPNVPIAHENQRPGQAVDFVHVNQGTIVGHMQPRNSSLTVPNQSYQPPHSTKFSPQDMQVLKLLLVVGEKHKWKMITKEIINQASTRRNSSELSTKYSLPDDDQASPSSASTSRNISPTFVIKQYQSLLGLPSHSAYFGTVGSSLPYIVAKNGWDSISDLRSDIE